MDTANEGGAYRTGEGVDIEDSSSSTYPYDVGWTQAGEWLEYTVNVSQTGTYTLTIPVASQGIGGTFHLEQDGTNVSGTLTVPDTGDWQTYQSITKSVSLTKGQHVLRLSFDSNGSSGYIGNILALQFTSSSTPTPKPGDANSDGNVDLIDYVVWLNNYGKTTSGNTNGDFNNSGTVDLVDYVIWLNNYGK